MKATFELTDDYLFHQAGLPFGILTDGQGNTYPIMHLVQMRDVLAKINRVGHDLSETAALREQISELGFATDMAALIQAFAESESATGPDEGRVKFQLCSDEHCAANFTHGLITEDGRTILPFALSDLETSLLVIQMLVDDGDLTAPEGVHLFQEMVAAGMFHTREQYHNHLASLPEAEQLAVLQQVVSPDQLLMAVFTSEEPTEETVTEPEVIYH